MGRPRKSIDRHKLEGSLYQHKYYLRRKATDGEPHSDPELVKEAERHFDLWVFGYDRHDLLADYDRAAMLWQAVRDEYMRDFPVGQVDVKSGEISFGPWAWWLFDFEEAPFVVEVPEHIDCNKYTMLKQREALIRHGYVTADAPNPGLASLRRSQAYYNDQLNAGRDKFWLPWTTVAAKLDAEWEIVKAKAKAYNELLSEVTNEKNTED